MHKPHRLGHWTPTIPSPTLSAVWLPTLQVGTASDKLQIGHSATFHLAWHTHTTHNHIKTTLFSTPGLPKSQYVGHPRVHFTLAPPAFDVIACHCLIRQAAKSVQEGELCFAKVSIQMALAPYSHTGAAVAIVQSVTHRPTTPPPHKTAKRSWGLCETRGATDWACTYSCCHGGMLPGKLHGLHGHLFCMGCMLPGGTYSAWAAWAPLLHGLHASWGHLFCIGCKWLPQGTPVALLPCGKVVVIAARADPITRQSSLCEWVPAGWVGTRRMCSCCCCCCFCCCCCCCHCLICCKFICLGLQLLPLLLLCHWNHCMRQLQYRLSGRALLV